MTLWNPKGFLCQKILASVKFLRIVFEKALRTRAYVYTSVLSFKTFLIKCIFLIFFYTIHSLTHLDAEDRPKSADVDHNHHHHHHEQHHYYSLRHILVCLLNLLLVALVFIPDLLLASYGEPRELGFFCSDETISHPYRDSTVKSYALYATGVFLPVATILSVEIILAVLAKGSAPVGCIVVGKYVVKVPAHFLYACQNILGYGLGAGVTKSVTHIIKYSAGRLRPHFFAVCQPDWQNIECANSEGGDPTPLYVTNYTCRGNYDLFDSEEEVQDRIRQSRLSFPSGHASFSAQAMVFLIIYLQARLVTTTTEKRRRNWTSGSFLVPFFQLCLATFAVYTSVSRVFDYKHHVGDVLAGAALGVAVQTFVTVVVLNLFDRKENNKNGYSEANLNVDNNGFHMNSLESNERRRNAKTLPH